jgi:GT2 family glycosyltransferase
MKIGYVCTNYNNSPFTCEAIKSLAANVGHRFQIVVVDNASNAPSVAEVRDCAARHDNVQLICNASNLGYFRGLNVGIGWLRREFPELEAIVVGNNDLVFPPGFADALSANRDKLSAHAVISPNIVTLDGIHQNPHVIRRISKLREVVYDLYYANFHLAMMIRRIARLTSKFTDRDDESEHAIAQPIYQGHGACYILTPIFFRHFSELWAPSFLMGEEFFLSRQLEEKGMQVFYEPSIIIQHHCHGAIDQVPSRRIWEISRAAHRLYRQHVRIFQ